ncbi:MAG: glycoside hydrolase family 13 protein [Lachnospiraceae bacterium]|nr:glycoside hydrolase family 13 protein [Lachnospiraceae bacterium]
MKERSVYELNKLQRYVMQMRPVLRKAALYSDGTEDYRSPSEPEPFDAVRIRFRAAKNNIDIVWFCTGNTQKVMPLVETKDNFEYYEIEQKLEDTTFEYYFKISSGLLECYYDRYGVHQDPRSRYQFRIVPGFHTPDWAKGAVMYQIFVDRFFNGDESNDVLDNEYYYIRGTSTRVPPEKWDKPPESFSVAEFYGGDLEGVRKKLDYLKSLGIDAIYFNPLFVSPSNHKYDIQDYEHIDPHFGKIINDDGDLLNEERRGNIAATRYQKRVTDLENLEASNKLFATLVEEAHKKGIKVILDGVFNHCGSFNKWMDKELIYEEKEGYEPGAYVSKDSPYKDYFAFEDKNAWPYNNTYETWWTHDTLPKLNYEGSELLYNHILEIAKKWVSPPYNADGWRLDVASDLGHSKEFNHKFWRDFRDAVKSANPDAIILAEHYGDPRDWLDGHQWDTIMNYDAFMEPLTWFLTGMEKHSNEFYPDNIGKNGDFEGSMRHYMASFMTSSLYCSMNQLSNHDHSRFLTRTNHKVGRVDQLGYLAAEDGVNYGVFREAVLVQMTWPGAPTIYYGDEAGVCGFTDPDNRRTYPWGHERTDLIDLHRDLIRIHKRYDALKRGSFQFLDGEINLLCYARFNRNEHFVIVVNNAELKRDINIQVWYAGTPMSGTMKRIIATSQEGYSLMPEIYPIENGKIKITMNPYSSVILKYVE